MKLIVKDKSIQVNWLSLTLTKSSGPIIRIRPNYINKPESILIKESILNETECSLEVKQDIRFVINNLEWSKRIHPENKSFNNYENEISGICLPNDTLNWFDKTIDFKNDVIIFQRSEKDLWDDFITRMLGKGYRKLYKHDEADKICKDVFDIHSCFWRYKNHTNLQYLNQIVNFFSHITKKVYGWTAFNAEEPITLITPNLQPGLKLKIEDWQIVSDPVLNNLSDDIYFTNKPIYIQKIFKWSDSNDNDEKLKILDKITKRSTKSLGIQDEDQFPKMPCCFSMGSKTYYIKSIHYEFWADVDGITVQLECLKYLDKTSSSLNSSITFSGKFVNWYNNELIRFVPISENSFWKFAGYNAPGRNSLYARIITPTYVRKEEQGLYWTYKKDDELICLIQAGQQPYILGAEQMLNKELECDGIALNAKTLVLSVSNSTDKIEDSVHLKIKDKLINTNSEKVLIDGDVEIDGKLDVAPE